MSKPPPPDPQAAVLELRRTNLLLMVKQYNGPTAFAKRVGYKGPSYVTQMTGGHREVSESTARHLETELGLPVGWFDKPHPVKTEPTTGEPEPTIDETETGLYQAVMQVTLRVLSRARITLSNHKMQTLLHLAYEDAERKGHADEAFIEQLIRLAS